MNKGRRAEIEKLEKRLEELKESATAIKTDIESIRDEEQDYFDNMHENFQQGEKGQAAETNVQNLESAIEQFDDIESSIDEANQYLQAAREGE